MDISVAYVNVFVNDFDRAIRFYEETLGLPLGFRDDAFKYASFTTPGAAFAVVEAHDPALTGRHTGIGLMVKDLDTAYATLKEKVKFASPPQQQPWGGYMAILMDPDGNQFYFDQIQPDHH